MKKYLLSALTILSIVNLSAQDSIPRLSFEFGVNRHQFAMDTVNNFIDAAINTSVKFLDTRIESGSSYNFGSTAFCVGRMQNLKTGILNQDRFLFFLSWFLCKNTRQKQLISNTLATN